MENDNYAEAKSYLEALSRWRECWAPVYLKNYFFADMSSTQRGKSMNSLLKGFIDCKTRLTEFLATFEHALNLCEEAEHISAYKKLVYPIPLTFPNPIENQAASCLMWYAWKKFEAEWSAKDAYVCEEITDYDDVHYPPELELAKDYVNFYSRSQSQVPGILASHESSGEIASKIAMDPDKCADFTLYLEKYLEVIYSVDNDLGSTSASPELPIINNPIKSKAVG
ncbi:12500_t:CDS:2 [Cetraspora pellucida]|uniref:12500_t:CDS:1 n=1 Tax=Cetraspora pellucida TaxID=1433469 RepID=A0A9N8VX98_9GLOM|nr:12500_t:CDS:2 [Cetraspora pellucida]